MGRRLELGALLKTLGAEKVYFQPPSNITLEYPCIIYGRDFISTQHADNKPYRSDIRYQVTVIDRDPDSEITEKVAALPKCTLLRHFAADGLNQDIYQLYF